MKHSFAAGSNETNNDHANGQPAARSSNETRSADCIYALYLRAKERKKLPRNKGMWKIIRDDCMRVLAVFDVFLSERPLGMLEFLGERDDSMLVTDALRYTRTRPEREDCDPRYVDIVVARLEEIQAMVWAASYRSAEWKAEETKVDKGEQK
jgi:hypothetical protein